MSTTKPATPNVWQVVKRPTGRGLCAANETVTACGEFNAQFSWYRRGGRTEVTCTACVAALTSGQASWVSG